jgi:hypothetical protein
MTLVPRPAPAVRRHAVPPPAVLALAVLAAILGMRPAFAAADAEAFLREVEGAAAERRTALEHVEADVVVGITSSMWQAAGTCEGRLLARRPGALRLRGYAAVSTVFDAVTDGKRFAVHLPGPNLLWVGPAGRESELVGLPVEPGTIVSALFGEPYGARGTPRPIEGEGGRWAAWDLASGAEVRARFRKSPALVEEAELWENGRRTARLRYLDYRTRRGTWWPTRLEFDGGDRGRLTLEFTDVRFDRVPPDAAFDPPAAEGAVVVDLEAPVDLGTRGGEKR